MTRCPLCDPDFPGGSIVSEDMCEFHRPEFGLAMVYKSTTLNRYEGEALRAWVAGDHNLARRRLGFVLAHASASHCRRMSGVIQALGAGLGSEARAGYTGLALLAAELSGDPSTISDARSTVEDLVAGGVPRAAMFRPVLATGRAEETTS